MKYGARNQMVGKVEEVKKGAVMGQVKFQVGPKQIMSSVMTVESIDELGLRKGVKVKAVIKAVNVLLVRE